MKTVISIFFMLLFCSLTTSQTREDNILGNWYSEEMDKSTIQIYKGTDELWYGKITKSDKRDNVGKTILSKVNFNSKENVFVGTLTRPRDGMVIDATITFVNDKRLKVAGNKFFITKIFYWIRI